MRSTAARVFGLFVVVLVGCGRPGWSGSPPLTIEVIGDSQAQGLAGALQRAALHQPQYHVLDRSKIATGLGLHGTYDWPTEARALVGAGPRPDIVVAMIGANDRPPIRRDGKVDATLRERFRRAYAERAREVMGAFRDADIAMIWVGEPIVQDGAYREDMALLNSICQEAAAKEAVQWLSTWDIGSDGADGYSAFGKGSDGMTQRLRADDGVHFTPAGYDVIAARLKPMLVARPAMLAPRPALGLIQ